MNLFRTGLQTAKLSIIHCQLSIVLSVLFLSQLPLQALVTTNVSTAQALQNALTLAAANGDDNDIRLASGYYIGNFNYNSGGGYNLTIEAQPGVTNMQITLDGAGTGSDMNISATATASITVQGITFLRNCGNSGIGALRIATGVAAPILVQNCLFLSPANSSGMGLELASGLNATVTNCTATGATNGGGGTGISISITGNATVQNCSMTTNSDAGLSFSGAGVVVTGSMFTGNSCGVFCVYGGPTITLSGNTFIGNQGGASLMGTMVTLTGNIFTGNYSGSDWESGDGGGVWIDSSGTVTLSGNTFTGNSALYSGGGADCSGGTVTLSGNTFTGNSGENWNSAGGGCRCSGGTVMLTGNTFTGNSVSSSSSGGGAYCSGTITLANNSFTGNSAGSGGGAYCSGTMTVSGNTFQQNEAVTGGGIYASGQTINLLDNLVANNSQTSSSSQGGGVWVDATSTLFMINNTVTGNTAAGSGGGAACVVTGTVELLNVYNNILWGNSASGNGGDVYLAGTGQQKVFDFNDADSIYGVWDIAQNNIDLSPKFFDPVNGDYHIQNMSPCRNAGTTNAPVLSATDLDGNPRIINGAVDMGCYEYTTNVTHPADTNGDFIITRAEFNAYAAAWQNGQTWTNGPNPIPANYVTRAGYLMTNGGAYYNDGSARPVNWKTNSP
jgi:hypothetical protein